MRRVAFEDAGAKPCKRCSHQPVIETWRSGGFMCMVKCNNPDCFYPDDYVKSRSIETAVKEWNERMEGNA